METRYRLYGIIEHQGSHLGGHYVAYLRETDGWKYASDSMVRKATLQEVKDCEVNTMCNFCRLLASRAVAVGAWCQLLKMRSAYEWTEC